MPILRAHLTEPPTGAARARLFAAWTDAFEDVLDSPRERMRIVLVALDRSAVAVGETVGTGFALLEVVLMPGRDAATKARLIAALADATAAATGLGDAAIRVVIHEVPPENLGLGRVTAAAMGYGPAAP